jgi:IstB-like ATP binding protein
MAPDQATLDGWLTRLHLTAIRDQLDGLLDEASRRELTLRETLALLCEREIARRNERRIEMATKIAHFPTVRKLDGFDFTAQPSVGRVEVWRGGCRSNTSVAAPFVWRCLTGSALAPSPHPAHRTGHADLPHPALGQNITPSPTTRRAQADSDARARSARRGARVDKPRPCVA